MIIKLLVFLCIKITLIDGSMYDIERGINEYVDSKEIPEYLKPTIDDLFRKTKSEVTLNKIECALCELVATTGISLRRNGLSDEVFREFALVMCKLFTTNTAEVCQGSIDMNLPVALYIMDNKAELTAKRVCAIKFQSSNCEDPEYEPWRIDVPEGTSPELPPKNNTGQVKKIVHITDIHYDPLYEVGSNSVCDNPLCCESINGQSENPETAAGYWGDYHVCDSPWHAIENLFQQVEKEHPQVDLVYFTGDIVSHQSWATSKKYNSDSISKITKQFKDTFKKTPVYPVLGNHESHPSDLFAPNNVTNDEISSRWLLNFVADEWSRWLPQESLETVRKGGYYTVLVTTGFRIIGLNGNVCYKGNLWLIYEDQDPYDQLKWLVETLLEAEKNQETVHILSHVPPGSDECLKQWSHEYRRIVDRFANTITAQFNGHTHNDEIRIFYGLENKEQVVNVAFNGGSFTTFVGLNPNYRIYDAESNYHNILDYDQWYYNLTEANLSPNVDPNWKKLYSFKDAYGLESLDANNYNNFVQKLASNITLLQDYRRYFYRESEIHLLKECDKKCLGDLFCSITAVEYEESVQCKVFRQKYYKI